jgi:Possible hemagglutinin (DUF637)/Pre-toxin domain with VENN motif
MRLFFSCDGVEGITYSQSSSTDSTIKSEALGTQLSSDEAVQIGVGAVTDVQGAILTAPKVDFVRSAGADTSKEGQLILGGSTNTTQTSHTEKTTTAGVYQEMSGHGETKQTLNQTQINGKVNIASGINTTVVIPEGDLKTQVLQLSQQPGMAYIGELAKDPKVNWQQVKLAYDKWDYSQEGLTAAGAALLAIAIAAYTGGMGAEMLGGTAATSTSAATLMGSTVYGAAANAGFAALAASAGVSFVNNGGDIGKTLKDMGSSQNVKGIALAMVSAGVLSELSATMELDKINVKDSTFGANLGKAVVNNLANALMTSAITGTPLEDNIKTGLVSAFISAGAGQAANSIGSMTIPGVDGQPAQLNDFGAALAHAIAGCMAGGATGGKKGCESGAVGAVVGELAGKWYDSDGKKTDAEVLNFAKVVAAAAAAVTGDGSAASVSIAVMTAANAVQNNLLATRDVKKLMEQLGQCSGNQCDAIKRLYTGMMQTPTGSLEGLCKANPQACAGQLPDFVQALKEMQTPEFKALVGNETAQRLIDRQVADLNKVVSALDWGVAHAESNKQIVKTAMLLGATAAGGGLMLAVGRTVVAACGSPVLTPACTELITELGIGVAEAASGAPTLGVSAPIATAAAARLANAAKSADPAVVTAEVQAVLVEARTGSVKVVYNGIEISPNLPPPVAGYGYSPGIVPNAKTDNQAYSHWVGFQTEVKLASDLADNGQVVLKWGGAVGAPGNDVISVNPITAEVTLWDTKYRSNPANIGQSPTFANQGTLGNAVEEARRAIDASNLSPAIKTQALENLKDGSYTTNTVGAGAVKNSVQVRYCSGKPC